MEYDNFFHICHVKNSLHDLSLFLFKNFQGNKQRQREKHFGRSAAEEANSSGKKIGPMPPTAPPQPAPHHHDFTKKPLQTRSEVLIDPTNDGLYKAQQTNTPAHNLIIPESSKSSSHNNNKIASSSTPHIPVKVHVSSKPTVEDITRVYNPYPLQNEYDKYVKDGFLFEPLKKETAKSSATSSQATHLSAANVAFSSEAISPYARNKDHAAIHVKNPVDSDKLLTVARGGYANMSYVNDERQQAPSKAWTREPSSEFQRAKPGSASSSRKGQTHESLPKYDERKYPRNELVDDAKYQDEVDIALKFHRSVNANQEIVESINKEIRRIKTGYKTETDHRVERSASSSSKANRNDSNKDYYYN
jgi:hypothetical protein